MDPCFVHPSSCSGQALSHPSAFKPSAFKPSFLKDAAYGQPAPRLLLAQALLGGMLRDNKRLQSFCGH